MYNCPKGMNKVVLYCIVLYCIVKIALLAILVVVPLLVALALLVGFISTVPSFREVLVRVWA